MRWIQIMQLCLLAGCMNITESTEECSSPEESALCLSMLMPELTEVSSATKHIYTSTSTMSGNLGSRDASTAICRSVYEANYAGNATCSSFLALVPYAADSTLLAIGLNNGMPDAGSVQSFDQTEHGLSWAAFASAGRPPLMSGVGISNTAYWSGLNADGTRAADTCSDWTVGVIGTLGARGMFLDSLNQSWGAGFTNCGGSLSLLCACW